MAAVGCAGRALRSPSSRCLVLGATTRRPRRVSCRSEPAAMSGPLLSGRPRPVRSDQSGAARARRALLGRADDRLGLQRRRVAVRRARSRARAVRRPVQCLRGSRALGRARPDSDLRSILSLYPELVTILARRDAQVGNVEDLKGKRVDIGRPGRAHRPLGQAIETALGWTRADLALAAELKPEFGRRRPLRERGRCQRAAGRASIGLVGAEARPVRPGAGQCPRPGRSPSSWSADRTTGRRDTGGDLRRQCGHADLRRQRHAGHLGRSAGRGGLRDRQVGHRRRRPAAEPPSGPRRSSSPGRWSAPGSRHRSIPAPSAPIASSD